MGNYGDDDVIEVPSDQEDEASNRNVSSSKRNDYNNMTSAIESRMKTERNDSSPRNARKSHYDDVQSSRGAERHRRSISPERDNSRRNEYSERQLEEGERPRSSERRNENIQHPARRHRDIKDENIDRTPRRDDEDRTRKRRRSDSSSSDSANMDEDTSNEVPMSLTWSKVEKVRKNGEKVYPSGMPRLSENFRDHLEKEEIEKAERKLIKSEGLSEPKPKASKTLTLNFELLKQGFKDVKDWIDPERFRQNSVQKYYKDREGREHRITIAVEKWPEPDFMEIKQENMRVPEEISKVTGLNTVEERRRWHHRSRYEAVYVCDQAKLEEEIQRKRAGGQRNSNMEAIGRDRNRTVNANMETVGQRSRSDAERSREPLLPPRTHEQSPRETLQMASRKSPARNERDSRSERNEDDRRRDESRDRGYVNDRANMRPERDDRYSRGQEGEVRRERSPKDQDRGYVDRNRSPNVRLHESERSSRVPSGRDTYQERRDYDEHARNKTSDRPRSPPPLSRGPRTPPPSNNYSVKTEYPSSPRARYDDRTRRSPPPIDSFNSSLREYQQMRTQDSYASRESEFSSLQNSKSTSRRDNNTYEDRRSDGYVKRER